MPTRNKALNAFLKTHITASLKSRGFRKSGKRYLCDKREVVWLVEIEHDNSPVKGQSEFTISCGVYIDGVMSRYCVAGNEPIHISIAECCLYLRPSFLTPKRRSIWWTIANDDGAIVVDPKAGEEISDLLSSYALPFLGQFETKREVAEFLIDVPDSAKYVLPRSDSIRDTYAAIIYSLIGDVERQKELMKRAYDASRGRPNEEHMNYLYEKFG